MPMNDEDLASVANFTLWMSELAIDGFDVVRDDLVRCLRMVARYLLDEGEVEPQRFYGELLRQLGEGASLLHDVVLAVASTR